MAALLALETLHMLATAHVAAIYSASTQMLQDMTLDIGVIHCRMQTSAVSEFSIFRIADTDNNTYIRRIQHGRQQEIWKS